MTTFADDLSQLAASVTAEQPDPQAVQAYLAPAVEPRSGGFDTPSWNGPDQGGSTPVQAFDIADGAVTGGTIADYSVDWTKFVQYIIPPRVENSLPSLPSATWPVGCLVFLTTDGKLYRNVADAWTKDVDGADIIANSITAGQIAAGAIGADELAANIILASLIKTANSGARIEIDGKPGEIGVRCVAADNTLLVNMPADGSPVYIAAQLLASILTVTGNAAFRGTANSFDSASVTTLQAGVQPPNSPPGLSQGLAAPLTLAATSGWTSLKGGYYDANGGSSGSTPCYVAVQVNTNGNVWRVAEWKLSDGSLDRTTTLASMGVVTDFRGITRIGTYWYMVTNESDTALMYLGAPRSSGVVDKTLDITSYFQWGTLGTSSPIGNDGTYCYVIGWTTSPGSIYTLNVVKLSTSPAYVSTQNLTMPGSPPPGWVVPKDFTVANDGDGNGTCFWADLVYVSGGVPSAGEIFQWTTGGSLVSGHDWPEADNSGATGGGGLLWDGTYWHQSPVGVNSLYAFTNWTDVSLPYWVCCSWYDDNGTTHETPVGPRASITMLSRRQLSVSNATIPVGGADDPDKVRVYMKPYATDPGAGNFKLQVTDALTNRILTSYNSGGAADGTGTAFPGGTGAQLTTPGGGWNIRGNDSGSIPAAVGVAAIASQAIAPASVAASGDVGGAHIKIGSNKLARYVPLANYISAASGSTAGNWGPGWSSEMTGLPSSGVVAVDVRAIAYSATTWATDQCLHVYNAGADDPSISSYTPPYTAAVGSITGTVLTGSTNNRCVYYKLTCNGGVLYYDIRVHGYWTTE